MAGFPGLQCLAVGARRGDYGGGQVLFAGLGVVGLVNVDRAFADESRATSRVEREIVQSDGAAQGLRACFGFRGGLISAAGQSDTLAWTASQGAEIACPCRSSSPAACSTETS